MRKFRKFYVAVLLLLLLGAGVLFLRHRENSGSEPVVTAGETQEESSATVEESGTQEDAARWVYGHPEDKGTGRYSRLGRRGQAVRAETEAGDAGEERKTLHEDMVWIASDIHYYSPELTDYGAAFRARLDRDDGKDITDIDRILDLWIEEVLRERPGTVALLGDLTLDGESVNHRVLSEKLKRLTDDGIRVLVVPGNHDIGCVTWASTYFGAHQALTETPQTAEGFLEFYHSFGYDQASASDASSLSYVCKFDEKHWFLMLDSVIYEPVNRVVGRIKDSTLHWMEGVLREAQEEHVQVLAFAHHNLMDESRLYRSDCTLENNREVIALLERYGVPLWGSGHLHLQRIHQYLPEPGTEPGKQITEIVSGCFSMYPFPYGVLKLSENGDMEYRQRTVGLPEELKQTGLEEFRAVITRQTAAQIRGLPGYIINNMADSYAELLSAYVAGEAVDEQVFRSELGYRMMLRYLDGSEVLRRVEWMLADTKKDQRSWSYSAE